MVAICGEGQFLLHLQGKEFSSEQCYQVSNLLLDEGTFFDLKRKHITWNMLYTLKTYEIGENHSVLFF